jgi:hypothetical protein
MNSALDDAKGELQGLSDDMSSWRDNLSGTALENTSKFESVSECADSLENIISSLDYIEVPEQHAAIEVKVTWFHPYGKHIGRSWLASRAASILRAMIDNLPEKDEEAQAIVGDLESAADEIDCLDFPGTFG